MELSLHTGTKISCVIPAFNCELWLARAVTSLISTDYPWLEILIVDDGSTDQTLKVAKELYQQYPETIRVFQHPDGANRGVSVSRNLGMEKSAGDWLCFLDADDYVYPHRFHSAAEILSQQPDVDGVHQLAEMVFSTAEAGEEWFRDQMYFGFPAAVEADDLLTALLQGRCWATSAIVFRRSLLERTGRFSEVLRVAEDCHLWFRMASVGKIVSGDLTQPVSAYWRRSGSAYQPSAESRLLMVRAMMDFLKWLKTSGCPEQRQRQAIRSVHAYVLKGLTEYRFSKRRLHAWRIALLGVFQSPALMLNRGFCGQLARLALGR